MNDSDQKTPLGWWNSLDKRIQVLALGGVAAGMCLLSCCGGLSLLVVRNLTNRGTQQSVDNYPTGTDSQLGSDDELRAIAKPLNNLEATDRGYEFVVMRADYPSAGMNEGFLNLDGNRLKMVGIHRNGRKAYEYFGPYIWAQDSRNRYWSSSGRPMERERFLDEYMPDWRETMVRVGESRRYGQPRKDENGKWISGKEAYDRQVEKDAERIREQMRKGAWER